jgi:hypothetical protein
MIGRKEILRPSPWSFVITASMVTSPILTFRTVGSSSEWPAQRNKYRRYCQAKRRHQQRPSGTRSTRGLFWVTISGNIVRHRELVVDALRNVRRRHPNGSVQQGVK